MDALNHCYGKLNEFWDQLHFGSNRLENLPKLFNELISVFDDQQTRMIGTQDEEELINDYKFYIVKKIKNLQNKLKQMQIFNYFDMPELNLLKQIEAELVFLEDKLALVQKLSQREKNQLKRSENRNKKSIEGFDLKVSAQQFNHKLDDSRDKIFNYKELIIKSENVQKNYNEAILEWKSYLINSQQTIREIGTEEEEDDIFPRQALIRFDMNEIQQMIKEKHPEILVTFEQMEEYLEIEGTEHQKDRNE